jgi:hypothetical protein
MVLPLHKTLRGFKGKILLCDKVYRGPMDSVCIMTLLMRQLFHGDIEMTLTFCAVMLAVRNL